MSKEDKLPPYIIPTALGTVQLRTLGIGELFYALTTPEIASLSKVVSWYIKGDTDTVYPNHYIANLSAKARGWSRDDIRCEVYDVSGRYTWVAGIHLGRWRNLTTPSRKLSCRGLKVKC